MNAEPGAIAEQNYIAWKVIVFLTAFALATTLVPGKNAEEPGLTSGNLLEIMNQDRTRYGLGPLTLNIKLERAALAKARDILENSYFAHTSPLGYKPWDFIKNQDFRYSFAGENLALNYTNIYELEKDFLESESHRENLLSPLFSEVGIAVVQGLYQGRPAVVTVQLFASETNKSYASLGLVKTN